MKTSSFSKNHGIKISLIYLIISCIWVFASDRFLNFFTNDPMLLVELQTYKGWFFVFITSAILYMLINGSTRSLRKSREKLQQTIEEKGILLSELHHRVKNNLAIIAGLIELQVEELTEGDHKDALKTTQYRIYSIAEIQELLYQKESLTTVPFHEYIEHTTQTLTGTEDETDRIDSEVEKIYLNINQAIPLSLLLNEILSQFKINWLHLKDYSLKLYLKNEPDSVVSIKIQFKNVPDNLLSRLNERENYFEANLINIYSKQLRAFTEWKQVNGHAEFQLKFKKSKRSGPSARMPKAS